MLKPCFKVYNMKLLSNSADIFLIYICVNASRKVCYVDDGCVCIWNIYKNVLLD